MTDALVIGAGPAGLMAADALARAGRKVVLVEAKPSVGRKFLMAGKSGLNLTKEEPLEAFLAAYGDLPPFLRDIITDFGPNAVQDWARGLGQAVFTGSTGRVFPKAMKASPLLRAWLTELAGLGVEFRTRWRWAGWGEGFTFDTPTGTQTLTPKVTVLALGGASWARLGSDGAWADMLAAKSVGLTPFLPANFGLSVAWSDHMAKHFGTPVKNVALSAGGLTRRGEFVVSRRGIEGGGIYNLSVPIRGGGALVLDLLPDQNRAALVEKLRRPRGKTSLTNHLRKALRLDPVKIALMREFGGPLPGGEALIDRIKVLPVTHRGPRPMDEAISTAGGVALDAVTETLMLTAAPGVFVAGEMLDWEAPTGGYLITACLATGRAAGQAAARW
ncbi:MAG: TIGR03862 family flavoprotein [Brevirhabdus sp.]